jgi:predicted secreted Zn-dependent protease
MAKNKKDRAQAGDPDKETRAEAARLANLPARERTEALAVHWRIANDPTLSKVTRDYARRLAETLESELARLRQKNFQENRNKSLTDH